MANLVIIPGPVTSKLIATMELSNRLRRAGHRVTIIAPVDRDLACFDFDCIPLDQKLRTPIQSTQAENTEREPLSDEEFRRIYFAEFQQCLEKLGPDLVIIDIESHEFVMAASQRQSGPSHSSTFFSTYGNNHAFHHCMYPTHREWDSQDLYLALNWLGCDSVFGDGGNACARDGMGATTRLCWRKLRRSLTTL